MTEEKSLSPTGGSTLSGVVPQKKEALPGQLPQKKWPASTVLKDMRSSTFSALFERSSL